MQTQSDWFTMIEGQSELCMCLQIDILSTNNVLSCLFAFERNDKKCQYVTLCMRIPCKGKTCSADDFDIRLSCDSHAPKTPMKSDKTHDAMLCACDGTFKRLCIYVTSCLNVA